MQRLCRWPARCLATSSSHEVVASRRARGSRIPLTGRASGNPNNASACNRRCPAPEGGVEPDDTLIELPEFGTCLLYFVAKWPQPFGLIETVRTIVRYDKPGVGTTVAAFNDPTLVDEYLSTLPSEHEAYALQCLTCDQLEMMLTVLRAQGSPTSSFARALAVAASCR